MNTKNSTISLFEEAASAISSKHLADVKLLTVANGERPSFDKLMSELQALEQELTQKGLEVIETVKSKNDEETNSLAEELHNVIKVTIEGFVKKI